MAKQTIIQSEIKNVTKKEADWALSRYAQNEAKKKRINAKLEERVAKIYDEKKEILQTIEEEQNRDFLILHTYATENREKLFTEKKSIKNRFGSFGFRFSTYRADTLEGFDWEKATELLKKHLPEFIKTTFSVDKKKIVSERDNELYKKKFPVCGINVKKDESFFVEV